MKDDAADAHASDLEAGPAPVAAGDTAGLRELGLLARARGRALRWGAIALLLTTPVVPAAVLLDDPVQTAQMLGYSQQVDAVVDSVRLADDQPRRKKRSGPAWTVDVSWATSDGVRHGTGDLRSVDEPFTPGEPVTVHSLGDDPGVSLRSTGDLRTLGVFALVYALGCLGGALAMWGRARRWSARTTVVTRAVPERVRVRDARMNGRGGRSVLPGAGLVKECLVDYRPVGRATGGGTFAVDNRDAVTPPAEGDLLDVWSLPQNGRGPFAVRRVSDGRWWTGRGPDPVPSIPAP